MNIKFDAINAAGVFFHLEELHSVTKAIKSGLKPNGVFVVQFLYMKSIIENCAFDQIYHEHLLYYNLTTLKRLLSRHGLELFDARWTPIHGGTIVAYVSHPGSYKSSKELNDLLDQEELHQSNALSTYQDFSIRIKKLKADNLEYLNSKKSKGKKIYGMGAPVKGNTLLNYFGVGRNVLDCLVEKNTLRNGLYSPGMHIPVVMEDENLIPPDIYYVLAWNFKKEILANNKELLSKGVEFYFPINPREF